MIQKALNFALVAHEGQFRKGTSIPYFFHPAEIAQILLENNCSEDAVCAGLLHDTVEEVKASFEMFEVYCHQGYRLPNSTTETEINFNLKSLGKYLQSKISMLLSN